MPGTVYCWSQPGGLLRLPHIVDSASHEIHCRYAVPIGGNLFGTTCVHVLLDTTLGSGSPFLFLSRGCSYTFHASPWLKYTSL